MSSVELAYLVLVVAVFVVFSAVLGWFSHQQSQADRRARPAGHQTSPPPHAVAAQ